MDELNSYLTTGLRLITHVSAPHCQSRVGVILSKVDRKMDEQSRRDELYGSQSRPNLLFTP